MASIRDLLQDQLDDLPQDYFQRFKSYLNNMPEGYKSISRKDLEKANQLDVVNLMVDQYGESDAAKITVEGLKQIKQNRLATDLEKKLEGKVSGGSEGPAHVTKERKGSRVKATEDDEYKMSSNPRGICLIINNIHFSDPKKNRDGSEKDEESLKEVFELLGFSVEVCKDKTAEQMKEILQEYGERKHEGDCFVCCILSHGGKQGVCGTDFNVISGEDIYNPFYGISCPSLDNKPKVFFIQACRGKLLHPTVQADSYEEEEAEEEEEKGEVLDTDAEKIIRNQTDFFIARSTIKGYYSVRNTIMGSWFIQSLCEKLKQHCPEGKDINFILAKTNEDVSNRVAIMKEEGKVPVQYIKVGQVSVSKSTLKNSLVFRPV